MANQLSPELLLQLYNQESNDPFLTLLTLDHPTFVEPVRFVNNTENVISRGEVYNTFPFTITLPLDDGETARQITLDFDNIGLELIDKVRTVTDSINVKIEMVLYSIPDDIQFEVSELKISNISYTATKITATLFLDNFLSTEMTSEKYGPTNFPGLF